MRHKLKKCFFSCRLINLQTLLNDSPDEILYGKAGYLYALLFVNKYTSKNDVIPADVIEKVWLLYCTHSYLLLKFK